MTHYSIGWGTHLQKRYILVERYPTWVHVAEEAVNLLCNLTGNRSCWLCCNRLDPKLERYHEKFQVPATDELVAAFSRWRGWERPFFVDDEAGYSDDYTRTP